MDNGYVMANQTLYGALVSAKQRLRERGISTFALDSEILLGVALNYSRETLTLNRDALLSDIQQDIYEVLIARRLEREPIAYILGVKEFYGRDFEVTQATLIPRPDTEIMIEAVVDQVAKGAKFATILDLGTGSGCIILTLLAELGGGQGVGIDRSEEAAEVAMHNAHKLGLAKQVDFRVQDWNEGVDGEFDIIVSNPPYIRQVDVASLDQDVVDYEPHEALIGGEDGLDCYRQLIPVITKALKPNGYVFLECGVNQYKDIVDMFSAHGFKFVRVKKDLAGIDRCIVLTKK